MAIEEGIRDVWAMMDVGFFVTLGYVMTGAIIGNRIGWHLGNWWYDKFDKPKDKGSGIGPF